MCPICKSNRIYGDGIMCMDCYRNMEDTIENKEQEKADYTIDVMLICFVVLTLITLCSIKS